MVCLWSGIVQNHSRVFRKVSPDFRLLESAHTQLFRDNSLINLYLTELYILFMMVKVDPTKFGQAEYIALAAQVQYDTIGRPFDMTLLAFYVMPVAACIESSPNMNTNLNPFNCKYGINSSRNIH